MTKQYQTEPLSVSQIAVRSVLAGFAALITLATLGTLAATLVSLQSTFTVILGLGLILALLIGGIAFLMGGGVWVFEQLDNLPVVPLFLALTLALAGTGCGYTRVPPGYVGVEVDLYGSGKGVQGVTAVTGMVWYNPFTKEVHTFPTFLQQAVLTQASTEGSPNDDSITFNSKESSLVNADVFLAYSINPDKVPELFVKFRQDITYITHTYVRSLLRDTISKHASEMPVMDILGTQRAKLETAAFADLKEVLARDGINLEQLTFIGGLRVNQDVMAAVNRAIAATQAAIQAENVVRQTKAEADQARARAQGEADSRIIQARGAADSMLIQAKAEAESNKLVAQAITPELIQWQNIKKWNGQLPQVTGGSTPFVNLAGKQ